MGWYQANEKHEHARAHDANGLSWPIKTSRLLCTIAYGHTTLNTPDLVRSRKLSRVGPG